MEYTKRSGREFIVKLQQEKHLFIYLILCILMNIYLSFVYLCFECTAAR